MGHTRAQRRGDFRALANAYKIPIKLSAGEIDQCMDLGKYDVFHQIFPEYSYLFRDNTQTFSDGTAYPANFFAFAGRAYIPDGSGGTLPVRYCRPAEIPMLTRNSRIAGTATQPVFFTSDQNVHIIPSSVTGVSIECFIFPRPLADGARADTDTDTMPEFSEPMIARSGLEFGLKLMLDQQVALQLNKDEIDHTESAIKTLYEEKFGLLNRDPTQSD